MKTYLCAGESRIVSEAECLACAGTWEDKCGLGRPLIELFWEGEKRPGDLFSPSMLAGTCPREWYFSRTEDWIDPIRGHKSRLLGTMWHVALERPKKGEIVEQRFAYSFETEDGEYLLSFQPDLIIPDLGLLVDWKTTRTVPYNGRPWPTAWLQISAYALMLNSKLLMKEKGRKFSRKYEPCQPFNITWAQVRYMAWARPHADFQTYRLYVEPMFPVNCVLRFEVQEEGQNEIRKDALDIMQERLELFLQAQRGEPPTFDECSRLAKLPENDGWPTWKCKKGCQFTNPCRKRIQNEERPQTKMYQDGIHEGQKGQIQALSLKDGAVKFVEGLSEEARENLVRALAEQKGE